MQIFPSHNYGYSKFDPQTDIPDLKSKVIIVTGGNSGIGYTAVEGLAAKGAKVYLGARDEARGKAAAEQINKNIARFASTGSVHWFPLDISTPRRAKEGAEAFLALENRLDVLIHNAGMQVKGYSTVSEGGLTFNKIMSTNHLGAFVLTQQLLPVLKRTAGEPGSDVRVVVLASKAHLPVSSKPNFRQLEGWNAIAGDGYLDSLHRYMITKLANVLFTKELQSRLDAENVPITCLSIHPGIVNTPGPQNAIKGGGIGASIMRFMLSTIGLTPEQGAYTTLFSATSPRIKAEPEKYKGAYVQPFNRIAQPSAYAMDKQLAQDLWACSEEITEVCLRDL